MDNNIVTISAREYEQLIRDSEKVRILTQAVVSEFDMGDYFKNIVLGVQEDESNE